jgi:hypothetical protein
MLKNYVIRNKKWEIATEQETGAKGFQGRKCPPPPYNMHIMLKRDNLVSPDPFMTLK